MLPDLIVGSCLQTPADVDRLAEQEGVKVVYCLQGKAVYCFLQDEFTLSLFASISLKYSTCGAHICCPSSPCTSAAPPLPAEDCDMEYFNLDISKVQERCEQRGDIKHVRFPIR